MDYIYCQLAQEVKKKNGIIFGKGPIYLLTRVFMHCLFSYIRKRYVGFSEFEEFRLSEKISKIAGYITVIVYAALIGVLLYTFEDRSLLNAFIGGFGTIYVYVRIRMIARQIKADMLQRSQNN